MNREILKMCGFEDEVNDVDSGRCPFCKLTVRSTDFTDDLSLKEFQLSGLCQECQDKTFCSEEAEGDELDYDPYAGGSFYDPDDNLY